MNDDAFQCILEAVTAQQTLKRVAFTQYRHTSVVIEGIKLLLNSLPSLEILDLRGNLYEEDVCMELLETAAKSLCLVVICIPHKSNALLLEVNHLNTTRISKGLTQLNVQFAQ